MYLPEENFPLLQWKECKKDLYGIRWLKEHDPDWIEKTRTIKLPDIYSLSQYGLSIKDHPQNEK